MTTGTYNASTSINGTAITSPVSYTANSSVILFVPYLVTTAEATRISGGTVPIQVSGNLTASQLSGVTFQNATGSYTISFELSGPVKTVALPTIAIPKSSTASGLVPVVSINGNKSTNQSYSQDSSYYYVRFLANFANGTQKVSVQLSPAGSTIDIRYVIAIVVIIALIAALVIAFRGRSKRNFYLPSQPN